MTRQHYLPATYLACFSKDSNSKRRERKLVVGDKRNGRIFIAPASKMCREHDLYTLTDLNVSNMVDESWSYYEKKLATAIDSLIQGTILAEAWADTLIPFVAGLLVRGDDFVKRFKTRLKKIKADTLSIAFSSDNINLARFIEFERMKSSIIGSKWRVSKVFGTDQLITNDIGYTIFQDNTTKEFGIAVPMGLQHVLQIIPKQKKIVAIARNEAWFPIIEYSYLHNRNHVQLNQSIAGVGQRFIFGSNRAFISKYLEVDKQPVQIPEPSDIGFMSGLMAMVHENTWARLITKIAEKPKNDGDAIYIDYPKNFERYLKGHRR